MSIGGSRRSWVLSVGGLAALAAAMLLSITAAAANRPRAHAAYVSQCSDSQYPATRDPSNPLDLLTPPGPDPLHGAHFFVDGPRHGDAAGGIEQLLGLSPTSYPDDYSWAQFEQDLASPPLSSTLSGSPGLAHDVQLLEKIGDEEETQNLSLYSGGGGPGAVFGQVQKLLCHNLTADHTPHTVPVFTTFFVYPKGKFCPSLSAILANGPTFRRQIDELATGTGRHPVVYLLEIDSVGTSTCLSRRARRAWETDLRYEIVKMSALPHTVVYVEAGSSDEASAAYVVKMLDAICVVRIHRQLVNVCAQMRGFFTNDTHFNWSINEIKWANQVSAGLQKLIFKQIKQQYTPYFVVNTSQNGRGPKLNPHPRTQGSEDLCNPPGRGLGRKPTADTAPTFDGHTFFPRLDAFLWTGVPGRSHGSTCHPGDAPPGVWFARFALELAANANQQLGPAYPGQPY